MTIICGVDIDECSLSVHDCHQHAACINIDGSFLCTCVREFGTDCEGK